MPAVQTVGSPGRRQNLRVSINLCEHGRVMARSPYSEGVVNVCRSIEGRQFHSDSKGWSFPQAALPNFVASLRQLAGIQVDLVPPLRLPEGAPQQIPPPMVAPHSPPAQRPQPPAAGAPSPSTSAPGVTSPGRSSQNIHVKLVARGITSGSSQEERFAAKFAYSESVIEACRATPGRSWDSAAKEWTFPLSSLPALLERLSSISDRGVLVEPIAPLTLPPPPWNRAPPRPPPPPSSVVQRLFQDTPPETAAAPQVLSQGGTVSSNSTPQGPLPTPPKRKVEVTLGIFGRDRISVQFPYDQTVQAAVKGVRGAEWNHGKRLWHLPLAQRTVLEAALTSLPNVDVSIVPLHPLVLKAMEAASIAAAGALEKDDAERYDRMLDGGLKERLMEFQREGVKWALQQGGRVFIADEMGLGKTVQALALAACYREAWPVLILVPSSLRFTWARMCVDWLGMTPDDVTVVVSTPSRMARAMGYTLVLPSGAKTGGRLRLEGQINILSYDILHKIQSDLTGMNFQFVILDESHYIKNPAAQRTLCALPLVQRSRYAILLSGTPALSRPIELQQQLAALYSKVYSDRREYGERYCQGGRQFFAGQEYMGASNLKELHALLVSTVMVRRLKADVLQQLPPKRRQQVFLDIPDKAMAPVRKTNERLAAVRARRELVTGDASERERLETEERTLLNDLYVQTGIAKCGPAQDHIQLLLEHDEKFLVFAHHKHVMDMMEATLKKWASRDNQYIRIDGSTPPAERTGLVARFQEEPNCKVALLSIKAAGVGLTLHAAQTVVFIELSWLPGDLLQAEDRCHRIGQSSSVNVLYLLAQETSDDIMWESVRRKLENVGEVLNGAHDHMSVAQQHRLKGRPLNQPRITEMLAPRRGLAAGESAGVRTGASSSGGGEVRGGDGGAQSRDDGGGGIKAGEKEGLKSWETGGVNVEGYRGANSDEYTRADLGENAASTAGATAEGTGTLGPDVNAGRRVSADAEMLFGGRNGRGIGGTASAQPSKGSNPGDTQKEEPGSQRSATAMFRQSLGGENSRRVGADVSGAARRAQSGSQGSGPEASRRKGASACQLDALRGTTPTAPFEKTSGNRASGADTQDSVGAQAHGSGVLRTGTVLVGGTFPNASVEGRSKDHTSGADAHGSFEAQASGSGVRRMGSGLQQCSGSAGRPADWEEANRAEGAERAERAEGKLQQCLEGTVGVPLHEELRREYEEASFAMAGRRRQEAKRRREEGKEEEMSKVQRLE
ncbi:hypothetical protein KFL_000460110 [Klebsormidium nitens]|uniref:Uncharacterized protein n=1 Tax=Klebsormidium nitens TaxID=105231 RepID=A0A1Y1HSX5_KLENI|nr:hypothetical protein KFL_000460110 [Klebsormidium nitens]|eukprot:GAQ80101.1 hypothetical protein KFL_000460110 [Klebsormidium nitens]